jgi:hypothetical protein
VLFSILFKTELLLLEKLRDYNVSPTAFNFVEAEVTSINKLAMLFLYSYLLRWQEQSRKLMKLT